MTAVTIITVVRDRAGMVGRALASVRDQTIGTSSVQHVVIDGASSDATMDVVRSFKHVEAVSEPDQGLYDAMNKGLRLARGGIIGLLNSDDWYEPAALEHVVAAMERSGAEAAAGIARVVQLADEREFALHGGSRSQPLTAAVVCRGTPITNARFFRRHVIDEVGGFADRWHLASDRDWLLRMVLRGTSSVELPEVVYNYGAHDGSLTIGQADQTLAHREFLEIIEHHMGNGAPPQVATELRRWRAQIHARQVRGTAATSGLSPATRLGARLLRLDPLWPARATGNRLRGWR